MAAKRKSPATIPRFAVLRTRHGSLVLPAENPYDFELVLQAAEANARSYGMVALKIGEIDMRAARRETEAVQCVACLRVAKPVSYSVDRSTLCSRCARMFLLRLKANPARRNVGYGRSSPRPNGGGRPSEVERRSGRIDKMDGGEARTMTKSAGARRRRGWRSLSGGALQVGKDGGEDVQPSRPQPRSKQIER